MTFGNGVPLDSLRLDANTLSLEAFREKHGPAFLVVHPLDIATGGAGPLKTGSTVTLEGMSTPGVDGSSVTPVPLAFALVRRASSKFDWISVGRHEGNDVYLPHGSISRFHAMFRLGDGRCTLQDAKSANGTFAAGARVPRSGDGDPTVVTAGETVRFGEITATFLDADGLRSLLGRPSLASTKR